MNELYPAMQFITMICQLKTEFIQKYNVENWEIGLLKQLYLDWESNGNESYVTMAYKRPFGNSFVEGDVRGEMVRSKDSSAISRFDNEEGSFIEEEKALIKFVNMLENLFREEGYTLPVTSFISGTYSDTSRTFQDSPWSKWHDMRFRPHYYLYNWSPSLFQLRDDRIKEILNN